MIDIKTLGYGRKIASNGPFDAATVILVRERPLLSWEVLLLKRHRRQDFMGGAFVFPGGRMEERDCDLALLPYIVTGRVTEMLQGHEPDLSPEMARGLPVAAIRETFEEAGILFACYPSGNPLTSQSGVEIDLGEARRDLRERKITLAELLTRARLLLDFRPLIPWAHWITPELETKRFNTRFFLARLPEAQTPLPDSEELTDFSWFTPAAALKNHDRGEITLMPPTLKILEELSAYNTLAELFKAGEDKRIPVVLPQVFAEGETIGIRFPHDPEYSISTYKQPPRPKETSRVVYREGRWQRIDYFSNSG